MTKTTNKIPKLQLLSDITSQLSSCFIVAVNSKVGNVEPPKRTEGDYFMLYYKVTSFKDCMLDYAFLRDFTKGDDSIFSVAYHKVEEPGTSLLNKAILLTIN